MIVLAKLNAIGVISISFGFFFEFYLLYHLSIFLSIFCNNYVYYAYWPCLNFLMKNNLYYLTIYFVNYIMDSYSLSSFCFYYRVFETVISLYFKSSKFVYSSTLVIKNAQLFQIYRLISSSSS
jgi:hypothetical protein